MQPLEVAIDAVAAETGFSGIVRVDRGGDELVRAYGLADRAHGIPNATDTQFALASGAKSLTALTIVSLIVDGSLELATTARSVLGEDLPLIAGDVTIEHLLAHRSGIGDYFDEHAGHVMTDYALQVPVHTLTTTEDYVGILDGHPTVFPAGTELVRPRSEVPRNEGRYGLGFWLHATSAIVAMEGYDAGVSFRSEHHPTTGTTHTVISNTSEGAWPVWSASPSSSTSKM